MPLLIKANENGYGIIARMPLQFGLLTGKFDNGILFSENDHRKNRLTKEVIDACATALEPIWQLCEKYSCSKTKLALSYILSYPKVSTIIPGIRTPAHVADNTSGLFTLEPDDRKMIEQLGETDFIAVMDLIQKQG